jgi:hypothetical protein
MSASAPSSNGNKWSQYMTEIYASRKKPQPLGTVVHDEIEIRARDKLKDYPGEFDVGKMHQLETLFEIDVGKKYQLETLFEIDVGKKYQLETLFENRTSLTLLYKAVCLHRLLLGAFMYAGGSAGTQQTYRANRRAFEKYGIIPRMLVDCTTRDISVSTTTNCSPLGTVDQCPSTR